MKRTGRDHDRRVTILPPITTEEHIAVQRESKARTTLLQSIPDDHVADFHYMDDVRDIWNAVKVRFGGNAESKKIRKSMLKQEFLEFKIREEEGLHKGYNMMQKILTLTLKTKGGLEFLSFDDLYYKLKTLEVDVKGYSTFSSSQYAGPSHSAFVSTTSTSKKMSYGDSPNYSLTTTYSVPSNSKTGSHRSDAIKEGAAKLYNLITGANSEEANTTGDAGRPIFHRFAKTDSMKVAPPPLTGDYTTLSDHTDLDESQMSYGTKSSTSYDPKYVPNDFVSCVNSDKSSEVNTNDFASSDYSVKSSEHKPTDSTSCASTSSVSTSVDEAKIESNVRTPIKEPIIVQDLPSFTCNSSDKNENTSRTSCNKNGYANKKACHFRTNASSVSKLCFVCGSGTHLIKDYDFYEKQMANITGLGVGPAVRPQPVPTGKPTVTPVPTGKPKVTQVSTGKPKDTPVPT
nr:xylulose kinase-1 [Tanacetum cinerariifolium]